MDPVTLTIIAGIVKTIGKLALSTGWLPKAATTIINTLGALISRGEPYQKDLLELRDETEALVANGDPTQGALEAYAARWKAKSDAAHARIQG